MKNPIFLFFVVFLLNGHDSTPQVAPKKDSFNTSEGKDLNSFQKKIDSLNHQNIKLIEEIKKDFEVVEKNKGYIANNEKKIIEKKIIEKNNKKSKPVLVEVDNNKDIPDDFFYSKFDECVKNRTFFGRLFHKDDCKIWELKDSAKIILND